MYSLETKISLQFLNQKQSPKLSHYGNVPFVSLNSEEKVQLNCLE